MDKKLPTINYQLLTTSPLVVIVGETASGKSQLAMELAKKFDGEIICADSWTVYKGFDIGTAKPSAKEQKQIKHHLLDIADPAKGFSAVEFKKHAEKAIEGISKRGKLPILVGGSGLYIDSVLYDYQFLPAGPAKNRDLLNSLDLEQLKKMVKEQNLDSRGIDMRNKRRIIRLIETGGRRPEKSEMRPSTLVTGLKIPSQTLKKHIENRVDKMLKDGLEQEVLKLSTKYGWQTEPMKGIGYREWQDYFAGGQTLDQTKERIISASNRLAKKQRTWFKRNKSIQWVADKAEAVELVTTFLNKNDTN